MILLIAILLYLVFTAFVVYHRRDLCCEGAVALLLGATVVVSAATIYSSEQLPKNADADWRVICVKSGGSLIATVVHVGGGTQVEQECHRKGD